jgi:hypothetical protein
MIRKTLIGVCLFAVIAAMLIYVLALTSYDDRMLSLNETEYYFNDRLASISSEGDSAIWIGTEFGEVCLSDGNSQQQIKLGDDRIYKVYTEHKDGNKRICWVGERNAGLTKWAIENGNAIRMAEYGIKSKGVHYSVYDIEIAQGKLFAATSQGVFVLDLLQKNAQLKMIYPQKEEKNYKAGEPFVARKIVKTPTDDILIATQKGVLHINLHTMQTRVTHQDEVINDICLIGKNVNILAGDRFYVENTRGDLKQKVQLDFHANVFYNVGGAYCFLDNSQAMLSRDLKHFFTISLRRKIPVYCNNVVVTDHHSGYVMLVTENALWKVPVHQSMFNKNAPIVSACSDNVGNTYYISARNEIFMQSKGSHQAKKIFDFIHESPIVEAKAHDGYLYYVNSRREVKRIWLTSNFVRNLLLARKEILFQSQAKITSLGMTISDDVRLYLGVQDGLVEINPEKHEVDTIKKFDDKYITNFYCQGKDNGNLYLTTLNHGIFYGKNNEFKQVEGSSNLENIRSMAITEEFPPQMLVLTGNTLLLNGTDETLDAKGEDCLITVGDSIVYTLPEFGVRKYRKKDDKLVLVGDFYHDVRFDKQALISQNGNIRLGCELGILSFTAGNENKAQWVEIVNSSITRRGLVISAVSILLLLAIIVLSYYRYRVFSIRQIHVRKTDLKKRLQELESVCMLLPGNYAQEIEQLKNDINDVRIGGRHTWKQNNEKMAELSDTIMRMNRNTALLLLKQIDKQRERLLTLEIADSKQLLAATEDALQQGRIEILRSQTLTNDHWLKNYEKVKMELHEYTLHLQQMLMIEGLTKGLIEHIEEYKELLTTKSMSVLEPDLNSIRSDYERIMGQEALQILFKFKVKRNKQLAALNARDRVVVAVKSQLDSITADMEHQERLVLLRQLKHTNERIKQVLLRAELAKAMKLFADNRDVSSSESEVAHHIEELIAMIYSSMQNTDPRLISQILKFNGLDNQQAKVLMLLMTDPKVKRTDIPGMIRVIGNLNPVVSRLMKNKIKPAEDDLRQYVDRHPASMAAYILTLIE